VRIDLTVPGIEAMHQRAGAKWSAYGAHLLSATIAEMDFPVAPPDGGSLVVLSG
jgi:bifunctional pyridoxal-dependent enzyme with beta-cystathionase and maltose regulon repressor activities